MNGDFYKVVQGGKNCPFLEKAKSCPNDVDDLPPCEDPCLASGDYCVGQGSSMTYCCCRRSSSPAKSRREAPPSPQMSNPVVEKASRRDPDEQLEFQGGELR